MRLKLTKYEPRTIHLVKVLAAIVAAFFGGTLLVMSIATTHLRDKLSESKAKEVQLSKELDDERYGNGRTIAELRGRVDAIEVLLGKTAVTAEAAKETANNASVTAAASLMGVKPEKPQSKEPKP